MLKERLRVRYQNYERQTNNLLFALMAHCGARTARWRSDEVQDPPHPGGYEESPRGIRPSDQDSLQATRTRREHPAPQWASLGFPDRKQEPAMRGGGGGNVDACHAARQLALPQ